MDRKNNIAVVGSGGFGREVHSLLKSSPYKFIGFIDKRKSSDSEELPIIGHEDDFNNILERYSFKNICIAIGDMTKRKEIFETINNYNFNYPPIIHSSSNILSDFRPTKGLIIYPGTVIMNEVLIKDFTLINSSVSIGHNVEIGSFCNINPGVNLAGNIKIGSRTFIGIGSSIKENIIIGSNVMIGAGSVVINDIPDGALAYGVPAKIIS